jgi:hypothetical protein
MSLLSKPLNTLGGARGDVVLRPENPLPPIEVNRHFPS